MMTMYLIINFVIGFALLNMLKINYELGNFNLSLGKFNLSIVVVHDFGKKESSSL